MAKIKVHESMVGVGLEPGMIAKGPFVVEHNDNMGVGGFLRDAGDYMTVWDGNRTREIDDSYEISYENDHIILESDKYESLLVFRPLELTDAEWMFPDVNERPNKLEELIYLARDDIAGAY